MFNYCFDIREKRLIRFGNKYVGTCRQKIRTSLEIVIGVCICNNV